jgi:hypothetical protein
MGSALPADTEASDTPDSVYREPFPRSSSFGCDCVWGVRIAGLGMLTSAQSTFPDLKHVATRFGDLASIQNPPWQQTSLRLLILCVKPKCEGNEHIGLNVTIQV